jgi:hypothetical protein
MITAFCDVLKQLCIFSRNLLALRAVWLLFTASSNYALTLYKARPANVYYIAVFYFDSLFINGHYLNEFSNSNLLNCIIMSLLWKEIIRLFPIEASWQKNCNGSTTLLHNNHNRKLVVIILFFKEDQNFTSTEIYTYTAL